MQRKRPPWYVTQLVKPAAADELDEYGHAYAVLALCSCGHVALIKADGPQVASGGRHGLGANLRCGKCGKRGHTLEVYRRPRA